jgi:MFS family permease
VTPKPNPYIALQHRNFRLLWLGQLVSLSGSTMQAAAILWHVSLLVPPERRGLALGAVGLVRIVPIIVFSLLAGVAADALNRRKLMLAAQAVMALLAVALAFVTLRGHVTLWQLYALTALSSAVSSFDTPARQALVPNLVPRQHLPNALSLNTIAGQFASVAGPSLGGLLIAAAGVGWVYVVNAASFAAVIGALVLMRGTSGRASEAAPRDLSAGAAVDGLRFVFRTPLIRSTMLLDFFANFFASAIALLPIFAQDILNVGAQGYGWLYAAPAVGAALASLAMARSIDRVEHRGRALVWAVVVYGLATVVFGLSRHFVLSFVCLAVFGAADTVAMVFRHVIRQLATPDHLRGRMTAVNMIFYAGGPQLGELEAGLMAQWLSAPFSVITGGIAAVVATVWIARGTPELLAYRREAAVAAAEAAAD